MAKVNEQIHIQVYSIDILNILKNSDKIQKVQNVQLIYNGETRWGAMTYPRLRVIGAQD